MDIAIQPKKFDETLKNTPPRVKNSKNEFLNCTVLGHPVHKAVVNVSSFLANSDSIIRSNFVHVHTFKC